MSENIASHIISSALLQQQQLEITGKFLATDSRYNKVIVKIIKKTHFFNFKFPKNTEIAILYFLLHQAKKSIHYTNVRNKIWQILLILHKLDFQQNQR